jgi:phage I-like protein
MKLRVTCSAGTRTPPKEFLVLPYGTIETTKGTFQFTPDDALALMAERSKHDAEVMIDWEHGALHTTGEPAPAAGWCNLELRSDGVWAVNCRWSPLAAQYLSTGEYRYFSPAYFVDKKTKHIRELINLALTNIPATLDIQPLVAAGQLTHLKEQRMDFLKKLSKYMSDNKLDGKAFSDKSGLPEERLKAMLSDGAGEPSQEEMKACLKAMGMEDGDGGGDGGEEGKQIARNTRGTELDLVALTGHTDPKKQAAELAAMALSRQKVDALEKEMVALRKATEERKRGELIERGKSEGKLTPSLIRFWANRAVAELEEFLNSAPSIVGDEVQRVDPASPVAILTREEREMCAASFMDPAKLAEFKKGEKSGANRQAILNSYLEQPVKRTTAEK